MHTSLSKLTCILLALTTIFATPTAWAAPKSLGNGFYDDGVASPLSKARGIVATTNGKGQDVVLVWLFDHRGGYGLLMINVNTRQSHTFKTPFNPQGDGPYTSILTRNNRYDTLFNSHFVEFDPAKPGFIFSHKTMPRTAMSMTEDAQGRIWAATYPHSGLVSYNPKTGVFHDYGYIHHEPWAQYQRSICADRTGWIYMGIGDAKSDIIGFNPKSRQSIQMVPNSDRQSASTGVVFRAKNGKCYGHLGKHWFQFYDGHTTKLAAKPHVRKKHYITGTQGLFYRKFPDGAMIKRINLVRRLLVIKDPKTNRKLTMHFHYESQGPNVMTVALAPNKTICGGTYFPWRFFDYNPRTGEWVRHKAFGQWNTVATTSQDVFIGCYDHGRLLQWNPFKPWKATKINHPTSNLRFLASGFPSINRPHALLAYPHSPLVVLAGTPGYGMTGGGLMFWNQKTQNAKTIKTLPSLKNQATSSLLPLPDNRLLGGTTTNPGTGGQRKAKQAELYIMNIKTKHVLWHKAVLPGVQRYSDLCANGHGIIYGFADWTRFFVFNPSSHRLVYQKYTKPEFGLTNIQQGPRIFVKGKNGAVYVLFRKGIAKVEPHSYKIVMLAKSPVTIDAGGAYLNGRIYFSHGSHIYSWVVNNR